MFTLHTLIKAIIQQLFDFRQKFIEKYLKRRKRLKTAEKSILTSFWVCAVPETWSKYTTAVWRHTYQKCWKSNGYETLQWEV